MLDCFNKAAETYGLKISVQETEDLYQSIYDSANPSIQLGDNDLRVLDSVTLLGSMISNTAPFTMSRYASLDREINVRLQMAAKSFGASNDCVWKNRDIGLNTKLAVYRAIVLSTLLYCSQSWVTYWRHTSKLGAFNLRCLRCIAGIQWQEGIPNTEVIKITKSNGLLSANRLKWLGHLS